MDQWLEINVMENDAWRILLTIVVLPIVYGWSMYMYGAIKKNISEMNKLSHRQRRLLKRKKYQ